MADLGLVAYHQGDYAGAGAVFEESLLLFRQHGLKDRVAGVLNLLGDLARLAGDDERAAALLRREPGVVAGAAGHAGDRLGPAQARAGERAVGDRARARAYFVESLALQRELGNTGRASAECLAGLAGNVAAAGQPERAARILAAGAALLETIGVPLAPADQAALHRDMAATRRRLGRAAWEAAWAAGRGPVARGRHRPGPDRRRPRPPVAAGGRTRPGRQTRPGPCPGGSARSPRWSPAACRTARSPPRSSSPRRRWATTSSTS